jgi:hypothetical protein
MSTLPASTSVLDRGVHATFSLDYSPGDDWVGSASAPSDFEAFVDGESADVVCDAAYKLACARYGEGVVVLYDYSRSGYAQAAVEEETDPDRLSCQLCNPGAIA